jgi:hypothetical protein
LFRAAIPVLHVKSAALGWLLAWLLAVPPIAAQQPAAAKPAGTVLAAFPSSPDPALRYVVYLHGRIVEDQGRHAVHPERGAYDFDGIAQALARPGIAVIGELRERNADPMVTASHVVDGVKRLLAAGVPGRSITVVGASKGSLIAMLASTALPDRDVGWVLLGNCNEAVAKSYQIALHGQVLSIFEASDDVGGTCTPIFEQSPALLRHDEVRLSTGLGHGYLYRPLKEWIEPTIAWTQARKR